LVHVVPFGLNVALAPYSILAAPVLWLGRLPSRKWVFRTALFWLCLLACALVLLKLQHDLYPDTNFFHKKILVDYATNYSDAATGFEHRLRRWARLIPHLVAFDVVAPVPLFTGKPDRITTFMWDGGVHKVALYSAFGWVVAAIWIVVFAIASFSNLRSLFRGDAERLGVRLLSMGWLFGVFWLFTRFGDDFLLYSELWAAHVVLWVFLGLEEYATTRYGRALEWGSLAFVVTLAANNFAFVSRMLEFYR